MNDDQRRAEPYRSRHGNCRPNAKLARLVAGRGHHAAFVWIASNRHGLATQSRIVTLLDGRVERVHVYVQNPSEQTCDLPDLDL